MSEQQWFLGLRPDKEVTGNNGQSCYLYLGHTRGSVTDYKVGYSTNSKKRTKEFGTANRHYEELGKTVIPGPHVEAMIHEGLAPWRLDGLGREWFDVPSFHKQCPFYTPDGNGGFILRLSNTWIVQFYFWSLILMHRCCFEKEPRWDDTRDGFTYPPIGSRPVVYASAVVTPTGNAIVPPWIMRERAVNGKPGIIWSMNRRGGWNPDERMNREPEAFDIAPWPPEIIAPRLYPDATKFMDEFMRR